MISKSDEWLRRWSKSSESLVAWAVMLVGSFVRLMSRRMAMLFASLIGDLMHHVIGLRRDLVYRNLSLTFPDKSPKDIRRIATGIYRNIAFTFIDLLRFPRIKNRQDVEALVDMDVSPYWRGTNNGSRGAVMVSGHYGNWELMALGFGMLVKPMTIIVKRLTNTPLDKRMNELRTCRGNGIIYDSQSVREGLRVLARGGILSILGDQSDPNSAAAFGEFLGRRATMFQGAAFFALKAKVPLFVGMCLHGEGGKYRIEMQEIETADLTFCKKDVTTLAARYTRVLEEYILRWPEEWFWLHNRWKNGGSGL